MMDTIGESKKPEQSSLLNPPDFALALGGPLFQLLRRAHLSDDTLGLLQRRMIIIPMIAWVPMLVLSLVERKALNTDIAVPFLIDIETHSRYLLALPLLIYAELLVNTRVRPIVRQFLERNLTPEVSKLEMAVESAFRLRNSVAAELFLVVLVYTAGLFVRRHMALEASTWYATLTNGEQVWTWTGLWYAYVGLPIFQFILVRWYFRLFIWCRFLWHVSRVKLNLIPTHPDRVGGLGFLGNTVYAFAPILMAHGILLSGMIANRIVYVGAKLPEFKLEIFAMVLILLFIVLGPLLIFVPQLNRTKRTGLREYGTLAQRYAAEFDQKWLRNNPQEPLLGSSDIQSLADLGNSFQVVREMRMIPFTWETIVQLAITTVLPLAPLLLTMFSLEQLLDRFLNSVF